MNKVHILNGLNKKYSITIGFFGLLILLLTSFQIFQPSPLLLLVALVCITVSVLIYSFQLYKSKAPGIKNNGNWLQSLTNRGIHAWILGVLLTGFYVILYWFPEYLGLHPKRNSGLIALFDPLSYMLKKQPASQWFVYGVLYTMAIILFGIKFLLKYWHSPYQKIRTISVIFFQTAFAFLLPEFMLRLNMPFYDFKNMWPLNYYFFDAWHLENLMKAGNIGWFMLFWGILMILVISPILTYFYGKRWYCSWVCGCGGLSETAGDSFRHLSDKSIKAWKVERYLIHGGLVFSIIMTAGVVYSYITGQANIMGVSTAGLRSWYGFLIGAAFSGVIGVGFYPLMGSRVWCRFGCPMAAILGIQQRWLSRFRITTNGGQCISCGNCSTYCEMGIDVRSYAQKGQNIVRASCVGCGICAAVCPRGVLKLENQSIDIFNRTKELKTIHITEDMVTIIK
ncbi:MAG: 4Fe-4S binding protein [Bacteroidota bacterium]|nr:4Fe-4S binding protein [Bacteroidota bacterium]